MVDILHFPNSATVSLVQKPINNWPAATRVGSLHHLHQSVGKRGKTTSLSWNKSTSGRSLKVPRPRPSSFFRSATKMASSLSRCAGLQSAEAFQVHRLPYLPV